MDSARAAGRLRYELLGPLLVRRDGLVVDAGPPMQLAVLAVLLLNPGEPVAREQIVQAVWGARAAETVPSLVATYVSRLRHVLEPDRPRRTLGGLLATRGGSYRLAVAPGDLDLHEFEAARQRARGQRAAGATAQALATLDRALGLWRGTGLDGLPGPFAALHRGRLAELRLAALEERFELALLLGRHHEVVAELGVLAAENPGRQRLRGLLMLALHRAGRQGEALTVFTQTRQLLISTQGLEPGRELIDLQQRILHADPGLELAAAPSAGPLRLVCAPAQLPSDLPDFTGRAAELRTVTRALGAGRRLGAVPVVLISGPPGVGKSALAVHAAHRLRERFPDGQLYAALHEPDGRPGEVGALLGRLLTDLGVAPGALPAEPERRSALLRSVSSGRRLLLVLDDAADAGQLAALLPGSPSCAVLVTSRGRLPGLPGARTVPLDCLGPADSRRLWRRLAGGPPRAGERSPEEAQVLAVCAGLPLALRAAAARSVARPGGGLAGLAARLADRDRRLFELALGAWGVARALDSAEQRLGRAPGGPAALAELRAVSGLGPEAVPAALAGLAEERLDLLTEYGLLQAAPDGRPRLHPLTALHQRTADGRRMDSGSHREPGSDRSTPADRR
ncbi:AfsR/SARP family transcriptional regulator [Kitasatospora viridis]|uniref:DNA-binding SARP family transcriptional activator n=1 Tax=Kitasatospora viridis TaxID=281105 RepID=A0A561UFA9_9ACTN|nr:BTAD domain-containing putative transcriptional regulator [Kitasatospora viridis]TWF98025.1 DNA-binding SARP family transcriptional activator [Kitasatospora viridis]